MIVGLQANIPTPEIDFFLSIIYRISYRLLLAACLDDRIKSSLACINLCDDENFEAFRKNTVRQLMTVSMQFVDFRNESKIVTTWLLHVETRISLKSYKRSLKLAKSLRTSGGDCTTSRL